WVPIVAPTEAMNAHDREWLAAHFTPLHVLYPDHDYSPVLRRDPQFQILFRRQAVAFLALSAKLMQFSSDMMLFLNRAAVFPVIAACRPPSQARTVCTPRFPMRTPPSASAYLAPCSAIADYRRGGGSRQAPCGWRAPRAFDLNGVVHRKVARLPSPHMGASIATVLPASLREREPISAGQDRARKGPLSSKLRFRRLY